MTRLQAENNTRIFNQPQVSPLTSQPPNTSARKPTEKVTNQDEDHFNESLLTLLNRQQDFKKQSFNVMQDITHRQEYNNLMGDI